MLYKIYRHATKRSRAKKLKSTYLQEHSARYYNTKRCLGNIGVAQSAAVHLGLYRLHQHWRADHQTALWAPDVPPPWRGRTYTKKESGIFAPTLLFTTQTKIFDSDRIFIQHCKLHKFYKKRMSHLTV